MQTCGKNDIDMVSDWTVIYMQQIGPGNCVSLKFKKHSKLYLNNEWIERIVWIFKIIDKTYKLL